MKTPLYFTVLSDGKTYSPIKGSVVIAVEKDAWNLLVQTEAMQGVIGGSIDILHDLFPLDDNAALQELIGERTVTRTLEVSVRELGSEGEWATYTAEIPNGLPYAIERLVAYGLMFDNDWTPEGTESNWKLL